MNLITSESPVSEPPNGVGETPELLDSAYRVDVSSSDDAVEEEPDPRQIQAWLGSAMGQLSLPPSAVSVHLVSPGEIRDLNNQYRQVDRATNVLTFDADAMADEQVRFLGDIVICNQVVREESVAYRKSFEARFAHMLIHGLLHLLGFDHESEAEREQMESTECELMASIGFADPYDLND